MLSSMSSIFWLYFCFVVASFASAGGGLGDGGGDGGGLGLGGGGGSLHSGSCSSLMNGPVMRGFHSWISSMDHTPLR